MFALAATPFILAVPAYADDSSTVSISVDPATRLTQQGKLYKATTNVTVKTSKPYGFNLTMQAATADLLNGKDQTHKISAPQSANPVALGSNQWGYALDKSATTFNAVPVVKSGANSVAPAVIADVTKSKPAGCTDPASCTKPVTFAANIDVTKLASGNYSTSISYTATAKPKPAQIIDSSVCRSGDPKNGCKVDIDANMIPIKHIDDTDSWESIANAESSSNQGEWYDYDQKRWANAITVKPSALDKYKNKSVAINQNDVLGYWVYIPRYAYEVMRRDATDKPVKPQNFSIRFEKRPAPRRKPAVCPETGKDYRTECGLNRDYIDGKSSNNSTWATHPAFIFGHKILNGIWVGKFEMTGTNEQPTVLPDDNHLTGKDASATNIGHMYMTAKSIGVVDSNNTGGMKSGNYTLKQDSHNLKYFNSRMVNNNDWGAVTYLSASKYGAGYGNVTSYDTTTYNETGIYDMSGGNYSEYVAAGFYSDLHGIRDLGDNSNFGSDYARQPYVNIYNIDDINKCTFDLCGGQALHEVNYNKLQWGNQLTKFVSGYFYGYEHYWFYDQCWFMRGKDNNDNGSSIFSITNGSGGGYSNTTFRTVLGLFRKF